MTAKEIQQILNARDDIVNHVFCDSVCGPVCGRKKTLEGYVDKRGIPCARNSCTLFNGFADKVKEKFKNTKLEESAKEE
mgnify:FL=1